MNPQLASFLAALALKYGDERGTITVPGLPTEYVKQDVSINIREIPETGELELLVGIITPIGKRPSPLTNTEETELVDVG